MSVNSDTGRPEVRGTMTSVEAGRRHQLLGDCRQMLVDRMSVVIHEALEKMSDELTALALKKMRADEQQALLEAVSLVRTSGADIERHFRQAFIDVFERRLTSDVTRESPAEPDCEELTLVEDSVVDKQLEVDRLVRRARSKLDPDEVLGMRARLAELVDRDWFDENRHPAAPEAIFEALRTALETLGSEPSVKSALLDAFEPYVSANLNLVYSNVNERLKSNSILPRIRPRVQVVGARQGSRAPADPQTEEVPSATPQDSVVANGDSRAANVRPAGAHENPAMMTSRAAGPDSRMPMPAAEGFLNTGQPTGGANPAAANSAADWSALPAEQMFEHLARQVAAGDPLARSSAVRALSDPAGFGVADLPMPSVEPPLLDALSAMQPDHERGRRGSMQLFDQLGEQARAKGSALDQLTVEIVSLVFDYIYNDRRLDDSVKQQLLRLQVVAVKAALLDRSFFARRAHPMRRLIDAITDLSTDPDSEISAHSPLLEGLSELVDWVLANFDADLSVFEDAIRRLDVLAMSESERRVARLHEITRQAEQEDALARAQDEARAQISERIDSSTPEFIRDFLERWWTNLLVAVRIETSEPGLEYERMLRMAEHLLWSVAPKGAEEIPRLAAMLPPLINGLLRGLHRVDPPGEERDSFFNSLLAWHTRAIANAKKPAEMARARSRSPIRLREDGSVEFAQRSNVAMPAPEPVKPVEPSVVDGLRRGCLLDYDDGEQTLRVKLAWISPSRKLFALSRYPDFARSMSRPELVAMFDAQNLRIAIDASPLDCAIESVADSGETQVQAPPLQAA